MRKDRHNIDDELRSSGGCILLHIQAKYVPPAIIPIAPVQFGKINHTRDIIRIAQIRNVATRLSVGAASEISESQSVTRSIRICLNRLYLAPYSWMGTF